MAKPIENNDNAKEFWENLSDATELDAEIKTALRDRIGAASTEQAASKLPLAGGTMDEDAEIVYENGALVRGAPNGGIELLDSTGSAMRIAQGVVTVFDQTGKVLETRHQQLPPSATDDTSKNFVNKSSWVMTNGDKYLCADPTTGNAVWDFVPTIPLRIVFRGDSRTALVGAPTASPWPTQLIASMPSLGAVSYTNIATSGETVATMAANYSTQVAPYHHTSASFVLMAGINDRGLSSAATIATNILSIASAAEPRFAETYITLENMRDMTGAIVLGNANNIVLSAHAASPICSSLIAPHCLLPESADFIAADTLHPSAAGNTKISVFLKKRMTEKPPIVTAQDPATFAGVRIAVDISDLTKMRKADGSQVTDGATIATWLDRSPAGINLTNANGALIKPVFRSAEVLKAEFSLASITTAANFVSSGPSVVYILAQDNKNAGTMGTMWCDNRAFVSRPALFSVFGATVMGEGPGNTVGTTANFNCVTQRVVHCAIFNGANSKLYCDGKLVWSGTLPSLPTAGLCSLGCLGGTSSLAFGGFIGGFSFFDGVHTLAQVRAITKFYSDLGNTYYYPFDT